MEHYPAEELENLIKKFEACELPKEAWTHEAHLAAAVWYLWHHDFETALNLTRTNITKFNESVGGVNSDTEGYHESITKCWLLITQDFLRNRHFKSVADAVNAFIASDSGHIHYLRNFYSKETLFTTHARKNWVAPDLMSIESL